LRLSTAFFWLKQRININPVNTHPIFGSGPVAFSKYESDYLMHSEVIDKLLLMANEIPDMLSYLAQITDM
jgi:HTH-type transcriptional regulator/antitoxin MqsA